MGKGSPRKREMHMSWKPMRWRISSKHHRQVLPIGRFGWPGGLLCPFFSATLALPLFARNPSCLSNSPILSLGSSSSSCCVALTQVFRLDRKTRHSFSCPFSLAIFADGLELLHIPVSYSFRLPAVLVPSGLESVSSEFAQPLLFAHLSCIVPVSAPLS